MMTDAEQFLVMVLSKKIEACTLFNELRVKLYHHSHEKKFIELPCTSDSIQQNIKRAYMQTRLWLDAPFLNAADFMDPTSNGYTSHSEINMLAPSLFSGPQKPLDVPEPCTTCTTCARKTCPCRVANVSCSDFCGCTENDCQNPCNMVCSIDIQREQ